MVTLFSNGRGITTIPQPLMGRSIQRLQRKMLNLNASVHGTVFYMGAPQWVEKEKAWVVWYYLDQSLDEQLQGVTDG